MSEERVFREYLVLLLEWWFAKWLFQERLSEEWLYWNDCTVFSNDCSSFDCFMNDWLRNWIGMIVLHYTYKEWLFDAGFCLFPSPRSGSSFFSSKIDPDRKFPKCGPQLDNLDDLKNRIKRRKILGRMDHLEQWMNSFGWFF